MNRNNGFQKNGARRPNSQNGNAGASGNAGYRNGQSSQQGASQARSTQQLGPATSARNMQGLSTRQQNVGLNAAVSSALQNSGNRSGPNSQGPGDQNPSPNSSGLKYAKEADPRPWIDVPEQPDGGYETNNIVPGNQGSLRVMANYIQVTNVPDALYTYSITLHRDVSKQGEPQKLREIANIGDLKAAFNAVKGSFPTQFPLGTTVWATDYRALWCVQPLFSQQGNDSRTLGPFDHILPNGRKFKSLRAEVMRTNQIVGIRQVLTQMPTHEASEIIRSLNAVVAKSISRMHQRHITQVGPNKFFINGGFLGMAGRIRAVRGYFTSIRPSASGVLLNVNTTTSAFLPPLRVSDFLNHMLAARFRQPEVEKMLRGKKVRITYDRGTSDRKDENDVDLHVDLDMDANRVKTFKEFGLQASVQTFYQLQKDEDGKPEKDDEGYNKVDQRTEKTVFYHFTQEKNIQISREILCVNVGKTTRKQQGESHDVHMQNQSADGAIWIPADHLEIEPNQQVTGPLGSTHTTEMIRYACRLPADNVLLIVEEGLPQLRLKGNVTAMSDIGFSVNPNLIEFAATRLSDPRLLYRDSRKLQPKTTNVSNGSWDIKWDAFQKSGSFRNLNILSLDYGFRHEEFGREILRRLREHKVIDQVDAVGVLDPQDPHRGRMASCGSSSITEAKSKLEGWLCKRDMKDVIVIILPQEDYDSYAGIKQIADLRAGRQTVCVVGKKLSYKPVPGRYGFSPQYLSNLALKVNFKTGGDNHHLDSSVLDTILTVERRRTTIVLGADVAHPGPGGASGSPSIACVVGSIDGNFMNYPGSMRLQAGGQETIEGLRSMVLERLEAWEENNKRVPTAMLFYRDGIGESQFEECIREEIPAVEAAYSDMCRSSKFTKNIPNLELTFVIVGKRHHTRFFPKDPVNNPNITDNGNFMPGLLVDKVVTNPNDEEKDYSNFFLQSHAAIKGTARSAHYHVLRNGMKFTGNQLPELTLQLCAAYPRATKVVSYVAPAYIADRLCERGRVYLRFWNKGQGFPQPKFRQNRYFGANQVIQRELDGTEIKCSKQDLLQWKRECVEELLRSGVWGNYGRTYREKVRFNPWHYNLDRTMFWM